MLEMWRSKERLLSNSTPSFLADDEESRKQPSSVRPCSRLLIVWLLGHQKRLPMNSRVLLAPGRHAIDEECPHCKTSESTALGTKRQPGGPLPGSVSCAFLTMDSIPNLTGASILEGGMILTVVEIMLGGSNCQKRASGFWLFEPGR